jgi:hypothetical protein
MHPIPSKARDCKSRLACRRQVREDCASGTKWNQTMSINRESDVSANLQIGPTSLGMVRIYIETETVTLPLDFDPDEADEIAEELRAAAQRARRVHTKP